MSALLKRIASALGSSAKHKVTALELLGELGIGIETATGAIKQSSLFFGVSDPHLCELVAMMEPVEVETGSTVIRQGARARDFVLLVHGRARVEQSQADGSIRVLADVNRPTVIGEESLVGERKFRASVRMLSDGILLRLTRVQFARLAAASFVVGLRAHEAQERLNQGASLVVIASQREASHARVDGSPTLSQLHRFMEDRDRDVLTVCSCKRAHKAALAAFLLTQWGYKAVYLKGGVLTAPRRLRENREEESTAS